MLRISMQSLDLAGNVVASECEVSDSLGIDLARLDRFVKHQIHTAKQQNTLGQLGGFKIEIKTDRANWGES